MPLVTFTEAECRPPFESSHTYLAVEWIVDCEADGACPYCIPTPRNPWDGEPDKEALAEGLADCWGLSRPDAVDLIALIRQTRSELEALSKRPHLHLKVWGRNRDAAPRYYEIPFPWK